MQQREVFHVEHLWKTKGRVFSRLQTVQRVFSRDSHKGADF